MRKTDIHAVLSSKNTVTLYRVDSDTRCPVDVTCVSAGNAAVVFGFALASCPTCLPAQQFLNSTLGARRVTVDGYDFQLDSLLPAARTGRVIAPSDYTAFVTVTRN